MNRLRVLLVSLLLQLTLSACSLFEVPPPPPSAPDHLEHTVAYPGETLGLIASWYTGASSNWRELRDFNAKIDLKRIRTGDTITIPERLLVRRDPMPKSFVRSFYQSRVPKRAEGEGRAGVNEDTILVEPSGGNVSSRSRSDEQGHDELLLKLLAE